MNNYTLLTIIFWGLLFFYWWLVSRKVKTAVYAQSSASRFVYLLFLVFSFALLYAPFKLPLLDYQVIAHNLYTGVAGVLICLAGVAFAITARKFLGTNWSAEVTLKQEHQLIQSGPYKFVRHPIYTGFELAFFGAAITIGQLKGLVGLSILFVNHYFKTKMEEEILLQQFPGQYTLYAKRVKRLIPFIF